jgi:NhaP-type Na+/H+ or K+/H+ antiporter
VWGSVIANGETHGEFSAQDWGYMFLLYILLTLIRLALFFLVYPITSRIGLSTNPKEALFQVYGGLRGAVGIALAIALDSSVRKEASDTEWANQTNKAFGMIGGIAFCTLVINGTTAGPLLRWLGLADSTETRKKIVSAYEAGFRQHLIQQFVSLLSETRFRNVNFGLVKAHVPYIAGLTKTQLIEAVERHRDTTAGDDYSPPYLQAVIPYLQDDPDDEPTAVRQKEGEKMTASKSTDELLADLAAEVQRFQRSKKTKNRQQRKRRKSNIQHLMSGEPLSAQEMRALFISLLRAMYEQQIDRGELVDREFLAIALQQSLEFAADHVSNGGILQGKPC